MRHEASPDTLGVPSRTFAPLAMDRSALLPAAFALVGTLVGYGIAEASRDPVAPPASPPALSKPVAPGSAAPTDDGALVLELRALGDRIEAAVARGGDARAPVVGAAEADTDRIVALLERCTTLIERLERAENSALPRALVTPEPADRSALSRPPLSNDPGKTEWLREFKARHLFWSYQDVLEAYGPPDTINGDEDGYVQWTYLFREPGAERQSVHFIFYDGLVGRAGGG